MEKKSFINCGVCPYIIFFLFIILSCSKSNSGSDSKTPDPGFVEFKINGGSAVHIEYSNPIYHYALLFYKDARYSLSAFFGNEANSTIDLTIFTDSLETKNYHYDSLDVERSDLHVITLRITDKDQTWLIHYKGDFADINISSYKDSRISGTFTGKLTPRLSNGGFGPAGTINITEGKINEVKVLY